MVYKINYVCSLGTLCHTAYIMKQLSLKTTSYPFDWIFSNPEMIIDCISDKFSKFLDKTLYTTESHHSIYGRTFIHRCPQIEENYKYYTRCIDRFNNLLSSKERKLFIMMFVNNEYNSDKKEEITARIVDFNNKFATYTENYTLLVIIHKPYKNELYNNLTIIDNIHFLELHTQSCSDGVGFNPTENNYINDVINNNYKLS